jgi:hypothetical protein
MTQIKENIISGLAASSLVDVFAKLEELKATLAEMKNTRGLRRSKVCACARPLCAQGGTALSF